MSRRATTDYWRAVFIADAEAKRKYRRERNLYRQRRGLVGWRNIAVAAVLHPDFMARVECS